MISSASRPRELRDEPLLPPPYWVPAPDKTLGIDPTPLWSVDLCFHILVVHSYLDTLSTLFV
jgi:hypothetical protein